LRQANLDLLVVPSLMLLADLVLMSVKNVWTERTFRVYGDEFDEVIFYQSLLGCAFFFADQSAWHSIAPRLQSWHHLWVVNAAGLKVPMMWLLLATNIASCFAVSKLSSRTASLFQMSLT